MPDNASNLTALRASGHKRRVYVSDMSGDVVLNASVSSTPNAASALNVAITVNSGSASNVKHGMRVVVETAGGAYKGTLYIRQSGTISSANLPVREFGSGMVLVESGDVLKVYDDWRIIDRLVAAKATFAPDDETYGDQNSNPGPVCNSGGPWAGWLRWAEDGIAWTGSTSYAMDPDSGGTLTHAWTASGGTWDDDTAADPVLTIATAGKYLVTHVATDADNSKTETQYNRVRVHDDDDPPLLATEDAPLTANPDNGWSYGFRVYEDATIANLPDGAPVCVWVDETINGINQSLGSVTSGRHYIKAFGYLKRDVSGWDAQERRHYVRFEVISPLAVLSSLPGFSKVMESNQSPDAWSELKTLTTKRAIVQLIRYYTNALQTCDLVFATGYSNKVYPAFYLQKQDPLGQMRELADGADARVTCLRHAQLQIQLRLELTPESARSAIVTTLDVTTADLVDYEMEREHMPVVETFRLRGLSAGSSPQAGFARWPSVPGLGNQSPEAERVIWDNLQDLYDRCSRRGAWEDRVYVDADGIQRRAPRMRVRLPGSYDVFDLYREWVGVNFTGNLRGVDPSDFYWFVENITYTTENGTGYNELQLQAATNGTGAVDDTPTSSSNPQPNTDFNFDIGSVGDFAIAPIITTTPGGLIATGMLVSSAGAGKIAIARDASGLTSASEYTDISTGLTGSAVYWLQVDPHNFNRFYTTCSDGLWKCDNIFAATPTWTQVLDNSRLDSGTHRYHQVLMTPYAQGLIMLFAGLNHVDVSRDYGATWTTYNASNGADSRSSAASADRSDECQGEISWHGDGGGGRIWVGVQIAGLGNKFMRWSNYFAGSASTFTIAGLTNSDDATRVFIPYLRSSGANNLADAGQQLIVFSGFAKTTATIKSGATVVTSANAGSSLTTRLDALTETWAGRDVAGQRMVTEYQDAPGAFTYMQRTTNNNNANTNQRVAYTDDFFATSTEMTNQPAFNFDPVSFVGLTSLNRNRNWAAAYGYDAGDGMLQITTDRGATAWVDALSNLGTIFGNTRISFAQPV